MHQKGAYVKLLYDCKEPGAGPYDYLVVIASRGDDCIVEDSFAQQLHLRVLETDVRVTNVFDDAVETISALELLAMEADVTEES